MRTIFKILVSFFILTNNVLAQENLEDVCRNCLTNANIAYEKSEFKNGIDLLLPCMKSKTLKTRQEDAWRLLGMCYLGMQTEDSNARQAVYHLLVLNPNYQLFPYNDPRDFTSLVNSFQTEPKLYLATKLGINYSMPFVKKPYSIKPASIETEGSAGLVLGMSGQYYFKRKYLALSGSATYSTLAFKQTVIFNEFDSEIINYKEEHTRFDVGLLLRYYPLKSSLIKPFFGLGIANSFLLKSTSNLEYSNKDLNITDKQSINSGRNMKELGITSPNIVYGTLDFGAKTEIGKGDLGLGFQFFYAFTNNIAEDKRYVDVKLNLDQQWIDSDLKLHNFCFYTTYSFPLFWRIYDKYD